MTDISKEYGTALFMLACEENCQKQYAEALGRIRAAFEENPQYLGMLSSPSISLSERLDAIGAAFAAVVPAHVLSYLKLLCERGRMSCLMESIEEYMTLLDASEHVVQVKVISAVELTEEEKAKLVAKLEQSEHAKVWAEYAVDPSLLGGLIVEADGKIMDGSLRHRLYKIKEVMNT